MDEKGLSKNQVINLLGNHLKEDLTYDSGKILGSMCSKPHQFARRVFFQTIEKNLGDEGLFPGTLKIEKDAIKIIGTLLSNEYSSGHIVSGGTEANILALWAARKSLNKARSKAAAAALIAFLEGIIVVSPIK